MLEEHKFHHRVTVRDTDFSGYVHHTAIIEWCERGRVTLLRLNGVTIRKACEVGFNPVTVSVRASFFNPLQLDDEVYVETALHHVNTVKLKTKHDIYAIGNKLVASVTITTAFLDEDLEPRQIPIDAQTGKLDVESMKDLIELYHDAQYERTDG